VTEPMTLGERYRDRVLKDHELNASEELLLDEVVGVIDLLDERRLGVAETRQQRILLMRLLGQLGLPDTDGEPQVPSQETLRGRKAAKARWDRVRAEKAAQGR
jgi:hypothetical protein